jgi:hypothetical protein
MKENKASRFGYAPPNNRLHPTANSVAFIRETCFYSAVRSGG